MEILAVGLCVLGIIFLIAAVIAIMKSILYVCAEKPWIFVVGMVVILGLVAIFST